MDNEKLIMDNYSERLMTFDVFTIAVSSLTSSSLSDPIDSKVWLSM